jgi:hypothetical protein
MKTGETGILLGQELANEGRKMRVSFEEPFTTSAAGAWRGLRRWLGRAGEEDGDSAQADGLDLPPHEKA